MARGMRKGLPINGWLIIPNDFARGRTADIDADALIPEEMQASGRRQPCTDVWMQRCFGKIDLSDELERHLTRYIAGQPRIARRDLQSIFDVRLSVQGWWPQRPRRAIRHHWRASEMGAVWRFLRFR